VISFDWLKTKGYQPGGGMRSPDGKAFCLNIPKNASTYLTNVLLANGWELHILKDSDHFEKMFAFVRDPVDRWVSGFATYATLHLCSQNFGSDHFVEDYTDLTERIIFDTVYFDDHTAPQSIYISQLTDPILLKYNHNLLDQIRWLLGVEINDISVEDNVSENNYDTKQISKFMKERLQQNPPLVAKLVNAFSIDYELINSTHFYDKPR
jgi:hypothetical protein